MEREDKKFSDYTKSSQEKLLQMQNIVFQGKEINLSALLRINNSDELNGENLRMLDRIVSSETLSHLITGDKISVGSLLTDYEFYHSYINVERALVRYDKVDLESLLKETDHKGDIFVFSGVTKEELVKLGAPEGNTAVFEGEILENNNPLLPFNALSSAKDEEYFHKFSIYVPERNIHLLKKAGGDFIWLRSLGSSRRLRKFLMDKGSEVRVTKTLDCDSQVTVVSGNPDTGKSTLLTFLSKQEKQFSPSTWVIRLNLKNYERLIEPADYSDLQGIAEFLSRSDTAETNDFGKELLLHKLKQKDGVVLLLDGYEKIQDSSREKVIRLIKTLNEEAATTARVWLATCSHLQQELEEKLGWPSYTLNPFDERDKICFLKEFWKSALNEVGKPTVTYNDERAEYYAKELLQHFISQVGDIHTVSQMPVLAEAYRREFENFFISDGTNVPSFQVGMDLFCLYGGFVDARLTTHMTRNLKFDTNLYSYSSSSLLKAYNKSHENLALKTKFRNDKEVEELLEDQGTWKEELKSIGIIKTFKDGCVEFFNDTCVDYFAANCLIRNLRKKQEHPKHKLAHDVLLQKVFQHRHKVLRTFIESRVQKEQEALESRWKDVIDRDLFQSWPGDVKECWPEIPLSAGSCCDSEESLEAIIQKIKSVVEWCGDRYEYYEGNAKVAEFENLFCKIQLETDSNKLKNALQFLMKLRGKSVFRKANNIISAHIYEVIRRYENHATRQSNFDNEFEKRLLKEFGEASGYPWPESNIPRHSSGKNKSKVSSEGSEQGHSNEDTNGSEQGEENYHWLGADGIEIAVQSKTLNAKGARAFCSTLDRLIKLEGISDFDQLYANYVLRSFVLPILDAMKNNSLPEIHSVEFMKILVRLFEFLEDKEFLTNFPFNPNQLRTSLSLMDSILDENNDSLAEAFCASVKYLLLLRRYGLKLIDAENSLLVLDPCTEFRCSLGSLRSQMKKLIEWRLRNPRDDLLEECKNVSIEAVNTENVKRRRSAAFDSVDLEKSAKKPRVH